MTCVCVCIKYYTVDDDDDDDATGVPRVRPRVPVRYLRRGDPSGSMRVCACVLGCISVYLHTHFRHVSYLIGLKNTISFVFDSLRPLSYEHTVAVSYNR